MGSDSSLTDSQEASALGHQHNYIDIYSNSWGPSDLGFIVDGPGTLVSSTFSTGTKFVSIESVGVHEVCHAGHCYY